MTYGGQVQVPGLSLFLNGSVLSVAQCIFNGDSAHDFLGKISVLLENSFIVFNYCLIDGPFGDNVPTWYDLDFRSLESSTYRFRIVLEDEIDGGPETSVFFEQDSILE